MSMFGRVDIVLLDVNIWLVAVDIVLFDVDVWSVKLSKNVTVCSSP
jgi:hypothetical protein